MHHLLLCFTNQTVESLQVQTFAVPQDRTGGAERLGSAAPAQRNLNMITFADTDSGCLRSCRYELSPFCKIAREALSELEVPHLYRTVARGSPTRQQLFERRGHFQAPYLEVSSLSQQPCPVASAPHMVVSIE